MFNILDKELTFAMSTVALKLIKLGLRKLYIKPSFKLTTLKRDNQGNLDSLGSTKHTVMEGYSQHERVKLRQQIHIPQI